MDNNSHRYMSEQRDNNNRCSECLQNPAYRGQYYNLCLFHYVKMIVSESLSELNLAKNLENEP